MPVTIKANSGGGSVTLDAGTTSTDTTLTLPSTTGTLLVASGGVLGVAAGGTGLSAPGTSGNVLTSNGTAWTSAAGFAVATAIGQIPFSTDGSTYTATQKIVQGTAVASTSGTSIDFTSIPSWVKRVTVMFSVVSTDGSSVVQVQLGVAAGIETTGYVCLNSVTQTGVNYYVFTSGFGLTGGSPWTSPTGLYSGVMTICSLGSNTWVCQANLSGGGNGNTNFFLSAGTKTLANVLDRVRITTINGTDNFDAGSINILYE